MNQNSSDKSSNIEPHKRAAIAIDLGGTNLRMGVVDGRGNVVQWQEEHTPRANKKLLIR